jgi:hypothetical protein
MEKAVFITNMKHAHYVTGEFSRLYFGNEFCQRLIPSEEELESALALVKLRGIDFSLVTSFVTEEGLERLQKRFSYVLAHCPQAEIIVNDWGVLKTLKDEFQCRNLILGRLLTKQKRGPRILRLEHKLPISAVDHFRRISADSDCFVDFLVQAGVKRIELDNVLQGIIRDAPVLQGSLYIPYAYVTVTRYCLPAVCAKHKTFIRTISDCSYECKQGSFILNNKNMPVEIILKGNSQFMRNPVIPKNLESLNIDRIVYEPEIPV